MGPGPFGHRLTPGVPDGGENLDTTQVELAETEAADELGGAGTRPVTLAGSPDPVPEIAPPIQTVDAVEARHPEELVRRHGPSNEMELLAVGECTRRLVSPTRLRRVRCIRDGPTPSKGAR